MTTDMGPPPPRSASTSDVPAVTEVSISESTDTAMVDAPPAGNLEREEAAPKLEANAGQQNEPDGNPPHASKNSSQLSERVDDLINGAAVDVEKKLDQRSSNMAVPYTIPPWSGVPGHNFFVEVLKDGAIIEKFDVNQKGAYMFGRVDVCDFVLEHPTISRFHAVLQFRSNGAAYLYDLGSTHGTSINKSQVKKRIYMDLHVGDVIRFGLSSRLYIFQGPFELMPQEADLKSSRKAKMRQEMQDMEASLRRAKLEASRSDGISWGMGEDAIEENEDEVDEITWQTFKGQLTEKQEKTREKVIKRLEKISHMKKEIDAIRAKDIAQGGLTQGQQTQIARNEQRISQIMEELDNLEETLNESIRESIGARTGKSARGKIKGTMDDDEDCVSDDDDFYDRAKKTTSKLKSVQSKSVETADSLLDKKESLVKEIEDKEKLLHDYTDKQAEKNETTNDGDALDAYMSQVSTRLVLDTKEKIQKQVSTLRMELDRILYLLRIADPAGEAATKRNSQGQKAHTIMKENPSSDAGSVPGKEEKARPLTIKEHNVDPSLDESPSSEQRDPSTRKQDIVEGKSESDIEKSEPESTDDASIGASVFTVTKPQWLGAVEDRKEQDTAPAGPADEEEANGFVGYKDRQRILTYTEPSVEEAGPGLLIRKRKPVRDLDATDSKDSEDTSGSEFKAEDAVALLLRHSRGYHTLDEEDGDGIPENQERKDGKKPKRVLGPERPSVLRAPDYDTWVPPKGQSGDGRTSLNDRFGY